MQSSAHVSLFVEILNRYLFFFEAGNDKVTIKYLQGLVDLINEHTANMDAGPEATAVQVKFLIQNITHTHTHIHCEYGQCVQAHFVVTLAHMHDYIHDA
jgi:hypothetical protein